VEKFDAIVVGAGPAGCIVSYLLARAGLKVLTFERGEYPGAKNMFGGVFYSRVLSDLFPNFWEEAPVERHINNWVVAFLSSDASFSLNFKDLGFNQPPYNGFTILRSKFDQWLAQKAQEAGALFMTDTLVEDLIWNKGKVEGVRVGKEEGEVFANVVIVAEGANALLLKKAGLRQDFSPEQMAVGVKEIINLPQETIEERFNLTNNEGVAYSLVGYCTKGIEGGGFIYTNKKSLSIGVVCHLNGLIREKIKPSNLIEDFKNHPLIQRLIKGGKIKEYSAHLIPEGGLNMKPQLFTHGLLVTGDASGFTLNSGLTLRGIDFAVASGIAAAETVKMAKEKNEFSLSTLSHYQKLLKNSFILKDLQTYRHLPPLMKNLRIYNTYPQLACNLLRKLFTVDGIPKKKVWKLAREISKDKVSLWQLLKDGIQWGKTL